MKERIQVRLEREFNVYKEQVLALDKQSVFDKSYETAIKQEIALFLQSIQRIMTGYWDF